MRPDSGNAANMPVPIHPHMLRHACDPPPLKWSDLRYVSDIKEDCNGKEAIQA